MHDLGRILHFYVDTFKGLSIKVWKLAGVLLINRSGMMVLPFLSIYVTSQLGWSKLEAGIITGCFGLGSLVGSYYGGQLADRIGIFNTMFLSLIVSGCLFISMGFFESFYPLCLLMFLTTCFADLFRPASFSALALFTDESNVTRGISLVRIAINLGISIGPSIAGLLAATVGYFWLFVFDGVTCLIAALFLFLFLAPPKKKTKEIKVKEEVKNPYLDRDFMIYLFFNVLNLIVFFQILNVVPVFFKEVLLMTEAEIGFFFTVNGLIIVIFEMPIIYWLELKKAVFAPLIFGIIMIGLSFLSFYGAAISTLLVLVLYNTLTTFGEIINFPFINTVGIQRAGEKSMGSYMGAVSVMFSVAFLLSPLLGLPIVDIIGYDIYWTVCVIVCFISAVGIFYIKPKLSLGIEQTSDVIST